MNALSSPAVRLAGAAPPRPIRLLLVDDSVVARSIVERMLDGRPEFEVAAVASGVAQALARLNETRVDIILLDLEMPGMDGLTGLPLLVERGRGARVLVLSSNCAANGARTVQALAHGAADTLEKPGANRFGTPFAALLADRLARIGHAPDAPAEAPPLPTDAAPVLPVRPLRPPVLGPVGCVALGASTGGLPALAAFLRALPPEFDPPILVTQHLPADFMPFFAEQLRAIADRPATVAVPGDRLRRGSILVAPGDAHIGLVAAGRSIHVTHERAPAPSGCLPSVDRMLESVAAVFGETGVGVVLSGMGRDGAAGARLLADAGGEVLVQDAASSVIWGMPGAVAAGGAAAAVLPPAAIAERVSRRAVLQWS